METFSTTFSFLDADCMAFARLLHDYRVTVRVALFPIILGFLGGSKLH